MAKTSTIMRSSVHYFLCNYHTFASLAATLIFPASAATLLSKSHILSSASPSSLSFLLTVSHRLRSLFEAANFPSKSSLFVVLTSKLSQTIVSFLITLPFTLTFFTLSKACIIFTAHKFPLARHALPSSSLILHLYLRLLHTHLFTGFIIPSTNAAAFLISLITFSAASTLGLASRTLLLMLSGACAIIYSIIFANVLVTCNLASIVSAMENCNGYTAMLKACWLIRGNASIALSLSLCTNLAMAAAETLFQMRVVRPFLDLQTFNVSLLCEAFMIAYTHSIISVIDVIISCCFYKSCRDEMIDRYEEQQFVCDRGLEPEEKGNLKV